MYFNITIQTRICFRLSVFCGIIPIVFAACFIWAPETPQYLLKRNKPEEAEKALQWFRGQNYDVKNELDDMKCSVELASNNKVFLQQILL